MKNRSQLLYTIIGFFVIFGLVISMNSNSVFAEEDNVVHIYELEIGSFIPNGATIVGNGVYDVSYFSNTAKIIFSADESSDDENFCANEKAFQLENFNSLIADDYSKMFSDDSKNYDGWVVYDIYSHWDSPRYGLYNYGISLKPSKKIEDKQMDQYDEFDKGTICNSEDITDLKWYKKSDDIPKITLNSLDRSFWEIDENENEYGFSIVSLESDKDLKSELIIDFEANKGDLLMFDVMTNSGTFSLSGNNVGGLWHSNSFDNKNIEVTTDGQQQFKAILLNRSPNASGKYVYNDVYFRMKNFEVYSYVNDGAELDTSLVEEGSKVYYKCKCGEDSDYKYSGYLQYGEAKNSGSIDNDNKIDNVDITKNPITNSNTIIVVSVIAIVLFSIFINSKVLFRKDS